MPAAQQLQGGSGVGKTGRIDRLIAKLSVRVDSQMEQAFGRGLEISLETRLASLQIDTSSLAAGSQRGDRHLLVGDIHLDADHAQRGAVGVADDLSLG